MRGKGKEKLLGRCKSKWIFYEKIVTRRKDENKMNGWSYLREKNQLKGNNLLRDTDFQYCLCFQLRVFRIIGTEK